ncbi:hypothetical protein HMPREF0262_03437 [Clostridium sp. ATCC 29733]|nr:hypothetical protein HMPREF0262_03437 [Clostridium sp. ATCC 29733]
MGRGAEASVHPPGRRRYRGRAAVWMSPARRARGMGHRAGSGGVCTSARPPPVLWPRCSLDATGAPHAWYRPWGGEQRHLHISARPPVSWPRCGLDAADAPRAWYRPWDQGLFCICLTAVGIIAALRPLYHKERGEKIPPPLQSAENPLAGSR